MKIDFLKFLYSNNGDKQTGTKSKDFCYEPKDAQTHVADVFDTYGRAFLLSRRNAYKKSPEILSDEEFEKYKSELNKKIENLPYDIQKKAKQWTVNKSNIFIIDKIVSDETMYSNKNIMECSKGINSISDLFGAQIFDKILSCETLYNSKSIQSEIIPILHTNQMSEIFQAKMTIIDKILSITNLCANETFMNNMGTIISSTESKQGIQIKAKLLDRISQDDNLNDNDAFLKNACNVIYYTQTPEQEKIAHIILSDENLYDSKDFMEYAGRLINSVNTPKKAEFANKVLSDERLYSCNSILTNLPEILAPIHSQDSLKIIMDITDKILSNEKLYGSKDFMKYAGRLINSVNTPMKATFADKVLSDERLYSCNSILTNLPEILAPIHSPDNLKIKMDITDKILSDEKLYGSKYFMENADNIIANTNNANELSAKTSMMDKIISDRRMYANKDFMKKAGTLVNDTDTYKKLQIRKTIADEILACEKFSTNKDFMKYLGDILYSASNDKGYSTKSNLLSKISSDKNLYDNENFMKYAGIMIANTGTDLQAQIANMIMSNENLYNNEDFMKYACQIINQAYTDAQAQIANMIMSNENLYNNEDFMKYAEEIVKADGNKNKAQIKAALIEKILSDKKLNSSKVFMSYVGKIIANVNTNARAQVAYKILSNKKLYDNEDFMEYAEGIIKNAGSSNYSKNIINLIKTLDEKNLLQEKGAGLIVEKAGVFSDSKLKTRFIQDEEFRNYLKNDHLLTILKDLHISEISKLSNSKLKSIVSFLESLPKNTSIENNEEKIKLIKLQNEAGVCIQYTGVFDSLDNAKDKDEKDKTTIEFTMKQINENNFYSKSEAKKDTYTSWYKNGNRVLITNKTNDGRDVSSQFEIVKDKNGEPDYLIYSIESKMLKGAYDTIRYNFNDYPEDMDIIEEIKNGTIKGGDVLSNIRMLDNGNIMYSENYNYENANTKRSYIKKSDGSYEYSYHINDENGNSLLTLDRSFTKNDDNTTTTVINNREYKALFDDKKMKIFITKPDKTKRVVDAKNLLAKYSSQSSFAKENFKNEKEMKKAFYNFLKTVPADKLLTLINCDIGEVIITEPLDSSIEKGGERILSTGLDLFSMSHELGHGIDFHKNSYSTSGKISGNKELIKIYNSEMDLFKEKYPDITQDIIGYFGQDGGGKSDTGLAEFVAETNALMTIYGTKLGKVKTRNQYIVQYFPKTIAKAAELLGYNAA